MAFADADASTPAFVKANAAGRNVTTAAFTPPAGALLLAFADHDTAGGNLTNTSQVTDSQGLTWTVAATVSKQSDGAGFANGHLQISWAIVGTSTSMTVTTTGTNTNNPAGLYCRVITGADATTPVDVTPVEGTNTNGVISVNITTVTNGARVFLGAVDWNLAANMAAGTGQTTVVADGIGGPDMRVFVGIQNAVTSPAGLVTMSTGSPSTGNTNNYAAIAIRPATGGPTPISVGDTGSEADALAVTATVPLADTAASTEALTASAAVPLADGGSAVDALIAGIAISLADTGTAVDSLTVTVAVPLADAGAAGQALTAAVTAPLADTAAAAEALTAAAAVALADAAAAVEALAIAAAVQLAQAGVGADSLTVEVGGGGTTKQLADSGHAADTICVCKRVLRPSTGTVTRPTSGTVTRPNTGTVEYCSCCS